MVFDSWIVVASIKLAYVEGTSVDEGETAELRLGEDVRKRPSGERGEGSGRREDRGGEGRRDR